ncbi:hypothetical protein SERLADRAFT_368519 [Serpula lacrymans var. lacrymans S7.9]|uniref:Mediator of RNA polymerase II transcription subunit 12 n=1 Tax=Serpula lacrymans var. lacrymans (strain S7.9) TaxID=578457 RepID=F8NTW2_SERL9|nr:uncharacterized protein SERLADRAFT_368519 [Serpula lacrymans var. lacrymans S7.9]EGO25090.1 hypothetical protein SERLADRAFT_368519 [Serpula lacrymans var. lacrymans S7.9]
MREGKKDKEPLPIYESHPPQWLPRTHKSADVGYPGFYPPRPGQDEDILSEANVKNGFVLAASVQSEYSTTTDTIKQDVTKNIFDENAVMDLENLMNEIFSRRVENIPLIPPSTFKIPSRVTANDAKRQAWFADLANPDVPLYKLGKSVPHGAKGHDLLDLLHTNNVAIHRAVWFLRVFGANETAGLRNKPSYNPTQYSVDWAIVVTSYLKKQLADIALPSAPRPGLNIKQTFKGVLSDADTKERWISRFTYCLKLLKTFYSEGLVDNRIFLVWLVQQMSSCNLAQAGFVARLADEYLDGLLGNRALARPFVEACLTKLSEIHTTFAQNHLMDLEGLLKTLLQRICMTLSDAFVSPSVWTAHSSLITEALSSNLAGQPGGDQLQSHKDVLSILLDNLTDIKRRNEAMLFRNLPPRALARMGSVVADIQVLNSISSTTDLESVAFFDDASDAASTFGEKLDILLTWSVTPLQYGEHRPYAAITLLRRWRERNGNRAIRRDVSSPEAFLQDQLFDWLDSSDIAGEPGNLRSVAVLFGKFVKHELFSYANYVTRLIARGEPSLSYTQEPGSRHRDFLRWIPIHELTPSLVNQRKVTLHGARARETPEDLSEREIRREIRAVLPIVFGGVSHPQFDSIAAFRESCPTLLVAPRFEQVRTYKQWFLPNFRNHAQGSVNQENLLKSYCTAVELLDMTKCFGSMLELSLIILEHASSVDLLTAVNETFHRFATIWTSMNVTGTITAALHAAHLVWRTRGIQMRSLLALLVEMDNGRHLDVTSREHVAADIASFTHALNPETDHPNPVPSRLPEILLLAEDPNPEGPSILANSLWYKYRTAFDWAWKVWDNTVASLRLIPNMTNETTNRHSIALRYGHFLLHIDKHLPGGFDDQVLQWFLGTGKNEVSGLCAEAWDVLTVVLLYLCIQGALSTTSILRGLVYPAWQLAANVSSDHEAQSLRRYLEAANRLFDLLLLQEGGSITSTLPVELLDLQRIRTRRQDVFREPHFSLFVSNIPTLVFIEKNMVLSDDFRQLAASLRCSACENDDFRQSCYRNLEIVRASFEHPLQSDAIAEPLCEPLVNALNRDMSTVLSPWRLAATAIQMQFALRQLGRALGNELTSNAAGESLDKMTSTLFHHSMTSEEAYFIAEMAKGVDGPVAVKFINNGFQYIIEVFSNIPQPAQSAVLLDRVERAGEVVRVLSHVAEPLREAARFAHLQVDIPTQEMLVTVIYGMFNTVESLLTSAADDSETASQATHTLVFLARLLQFDLGFAGMWTSKFREAASNLCTTLFRLVLLHASGPFFGLVAYPLLLDTLFYLIDELSTQAKSGTLDYFRYYPNLTESDLSHDIPIEYRQQLCTLLPQLPANPVVINLSNAYRDPSGHLVHGSPVLNRPWEWTENLGEPAAPMNSDEEHKEREEQVKNSASLSLELFAARHAGGRIIRSSGVVEEPRTESDIRLFEDNVSSESIYRRDWRESRLEFQRELKASGNVFKGEEGDEVGALHVFATQGRAPSRRTSPASSVKSRGSAHGSLRQSPGQLSYHRASTSTMSESIEVDSAGTSSSIVKISHKRKVSTDDEVEIIEGPLPNTSRMKKAKVKTATTKAKTKKR